MEHFDTSPERIEAERSRFAEMVSHEALFSQDNEELLGRLRNLLPEGFLRVNA
jgi:hypothetical protein